MNKYGVISFVFFLVSLLIFGIWFFNEKAINGTVVMVAAVFLPIAGILLALKDNGALKIAGIIGNTLVLIFSVLTPVVSMLFWNQP